MKPLEERKVPVVHLRPSPPAAKKGREGLKTEERICYVSYRGRLRN